MNTLEIFDPPMCCATGVCGPDPDPRLPQFAADLAWLATLGIHVTRYNLAQEPAAFAATVARGRYPTRPALARLAGIAPEEDRS